MRRRVFLALPSLVLLSGALVRPESLLVRRAQFFDHGDRVSMSMALPELLRPTDRDAMAWLDSGFETLLVYDLALIEHGTHRLVEQHQYLVKLRYDYMGGARYEVKTYFDGAFVRRGYVRRAREAVRTAVRLHMVSVGDVAHMVRHPQRSYYVTVVAQRNPMDPQQASRGFDPDAGRAQGRDVRWFRRLVYFLAGDLPKAEVAVRYRTQPFYLEAR